MKSPLLALLFAISFAGAARAAEGAGDFPYDAHSVLHAAHAQQLEDIGEDVVRFSREPALGGRGWVLELHRDGPKRAIGQITFFYGHPSTHWTQAGWLKFAMSAEDYDALSARIDALLAKKVEPGSGVGTLENQDGTKEIVVCTDGPGYLTERRKNGRSTWLSGFCGDHPNNTIARLMLNVAVSAACHLGGGIECSSSPKDDNR